MDATPSQQNSHRLADSSNGRKTLYAVEIAIVATVYNNQITMFDLSFDVIKGNLPALVGATTLKTMQLNINFENLNFGLTFG